MAGEIAEKPRHSLITLKNHLVEHMRKKLPLVIEQELEMHEQTFHQPEEKENYDIVWKVKSMIKRLNK